MKLAAAFFAWLLLTFAAPLLAMVFWRVGTRRSGWIAHITFIPVTLLVDWTVLSFLSWALDDHGDSPPGLGIAMLPGAAILLVSIVSYYIALVLKAVSAVRKAPLR